MFSKLLTTLMLLMLSAHVSAQAKIIFDTDLGGDADDLDNSRHDQTAMIYAVEQGIDEYWNRVSLGSYIPDSTGGNKWVHALESNHSYLELISDPEEVATLIESLMLFKTEE